MSSSANLARQLAAYLPETLVRHILDAALPEPGRPYAFNAATLFSDISGFTAMSEELAADGPRGAEELNQVLLLTFTGMIDIIHSMGGAVSHFYGDAMSVYMPDTDGFAAQRALACAQMMQKLMRTSFNRVVTNRPPDKNPFFELTIKIGVGYGRCQELVVGTPETGMEFVLTGPAVDEAAAAEKQAQSGQVVASWSVLEAAKQQGLTDFAVITQPVAAPPARPLVDWTAVSAEAAARLQKAATAFVPPAIVSRLEESSAESLAEHRPVTSLFVQFDFEGDHDDTSAIETAVMGQQIQEYYTWACQLVSRFGSQNARVNRVLTGDKGNQLHIIFGAPVAPDAPEQAVRCMMALQQERPKFITSQKIGMATGKVFAGPVGAGSRREYTVVGDVVNLSARLMQICEPGQVWTDRATAVRAKSAVDFSELPPVKLKGKQDEVTPFAARRERLQAQELQAFLGDWKTPLIGRAREVALIQSRLDAALAGQGRLISVVGATGAGKTRLVAAGAAYWLGQNGRGFIGEAYPHTAETPFGPWRQIWRSFFGLDGGMDARAQATAVVNRTRELVPDCGDDVGLWGEVMGLPIPQADSLTQLTAEVRKARFFRLVRRCLIAAAAARPLLLIMEGLHWADQASLTLIDELAAHIAEQPLAMILAYRPPISHTWDEVNPEMMTTISVSDLSPNQARLLLVELVGVAELPAAVEQQLGLRDREGRDSPVNPLFLEESVNVMVGMGALRMNGRVQVDEALLGQMQVPDTIHGLLLARLDRLPPASRDVLQIASVIGREFGLDALNHLTPTAVRPRLPELLESLTAAEMTRLLAADPKWVYLFQHAMTHEVAYESLPYARRQELHAAIASWLEKTFAENLKPFWATLAYHYGRADLHEKGLQFSLAAGNAARDIFANAEAVELYKQAERHLSALGMEKQWQTAVKLLLARGDVLRLMGDFHQAMADAEKAKTLSEKKQAHQDMAEAVNLMADIHFRLAEYAQAQANAAFVINHLGERITSDELARAHFWYGMAAGTTSEFEKALSHLSQAEKICRETHNNNRLSRVLEGIAFVHYSQRDLPMALAAMQQSVQLARTYSLPSNVATALNNIALIQSTLGHYQDAQDTLAEAVQLARESSQNFLARFLGNQGEVLTYLGRFPEAYACFTEALSLYREMDDKAGLIEVSLGLAQDYYLVLEQWSDANQNLDVVEELVNDDSDRYPESFARLQIARGQTAVGQGQFQEAVKELKNGLSWIDLYDIAWWRPACHFYLGLAYQKMGNDKEAQVHFESTLAAIDKRGCPDFAPLAWISMAKMESAGSQQKEKINRSLELADKRAKFWDKVICFKQAVNLLSQYEDELSQKQSSICQRKIERLLANFSEMPETS